MAKNKRSDRARIDADGKEILDVGNAAGARYSLVQQDGVDADGDPKYKSVEDFDVYLDPQHPKYIGDFGVIAFATIGVHTKVGNVANTVLNNKEKPGTLDDARNAITDFLNGVREGQWREPGAAIGPRYDVAILATAIAQVTGKPESDYTGKMDWRVDQRTGGRVALGADGSYAKGSITYPAFAMRNKAVAAKYAELGGATGKEVDLSAL